MSDLIVAAYEKFFASEDGQRIAKTDRVSYAVFAAGWNAARAETRSDASQPTGGRLHVAHRASDPSDDQLYTRRRLDKDGNWQTVEPDAIDYVDRSHEWG